MTTSECITVFLADDHPIVRDGLRDILTRDPRFTVVGEAGDGIETLRLITELHPDVLILDIEMPGKNGLDVAREIRDRSIPVAILVLTMYHQESIFNRAMDLGVTGYVLKDSVGTDIIHGIEAVMKGEYYISPVLMNYRMRGKTAADTVSEDVLSEKEREILDMIASSRSTAQIAEGLHRSPRTIEHYRERICQKLHLSGSYALLRYALEYKARMPLKR
jgi:DNA-binding NarL/FixJ family response regulator